MVKEKINFLFDPAANYKTIFMDNDIIIFGETDFRNQKKKFGIKLDDRRRHVYIIGKTGTGKTTLAENMAIQDIQSDRGVGVVDPHGEFAEKMLDFVPSNRINDVIYFNPADLDFPIAFNVLEKVSAEHRHLVASGLMGVFKKIWPDVWSARMEYILNNAVLALLEYPGSTLLGINKILSDKHYREKVVDRLSDPSVKSFWVNEFAKYPDRFREEAVAPIQNKVGQFISSPLIRNIIGQTKSSLNFREIMDGKKILIMNLSKGKIGEDASRLLGALCITKLQLAAMSRVDVLEEERKDFFLYVDEFQNFATESFANILSEARKYHLALILLHQYIEQLVQGDNTTVKNAIFGNVGTLVTFRVGAGDAEFLEKEFEPEFMINDIVGLGFAQIYLKLMIDGFSSRPFSAVTLPPVQRQEKSHREKIIKISRERYGGTSRQEVEEKISRWSESSGGDNNNQREASRRETISIRKQPIVSAGSSAHRANPSTESNSARFVDKATSQEWRGGQSENVSDKPIFIEKCAQCGKRVEVSFKPDGVRPIYCRDCLIMVRSQIGVKIEAPSKSSSQPVVRETGKTISLVQALGQRPAEFKPQKRQRKELDLVGLRDVLRGVSSSERTTNLPPAVKEKDIPEIVSKSKTEKKELKPGEPVEL